MEGDGDIREDLNTEALDGLTIDPDEKEDIDTLLGDDEPKSEEQKKKKKKKKKKKSKQIEGQE